MQRRCGYWNRSSGMHERTELRGRVRRIYYRHGNKAKQHAYPQCQSVMTGFQCGMRSMSIRVMRRRTTTRRGGQQTQTPTGRFAGLLRNKTYMDEVRRGKEC
jgi:hypothetical protein